MTKEHAKKTVEGLLNVIRAYKRASEESSGREEQDKLEETSESLINLLTAKPVITQEQLWSLISSLKELAYEQASNSEHSKGANELEKVLEEIFEVIPLSPL